MKDIIYVWTVKPGPFNFPETNPNNMWGIGDIIRGMITTLKRYEHSEISYNYRMDSLQAAALNVKLKYINDWTKRRRNIARAYQKNITNDNLKIAFEVKDRYHVYHIFSIFTENSIKLRSFLNKNFIGTNNHYPIPVHLQKPYLSLGYKKKDLPNTEYLSSSQLSIPIYPEMKISDAIYVSNLINIFNKK